MLQILLFFVLKLKMFRRLVFPAPDSPMIAVISPGFATPVMLSMMVFSYMTSFLEPFFGILHLTLKVRFCHEMWT